MCRLSWNLGAPASWNHQDLSRPVMGLLYLCFMGMFMGHHRTSYPTPCNNVWLVVLIKHETKQRHVPGLHFVDNLWKVWNEVWEVRVGHIWVYLARPGQCSNMSLMSDIQTRSVQLRQWWWKDNLVINFLFYTMTNKCTIISQIITLLHVSTPSCHPQRALINTLPRYASISNAAVGNRVYN